MSGFTSGPWRLLERNRLCIESDTGNVAICNLARNNEADARLIAAAPGVLAEHRRNPELMKELQEKHLSHCATVVRALLHHRIEATRAAIEKATT